MPILFELRRYATLAWQHRWKAVALAWLVCIAGWAVVYSMPNQYRASTRMFADADAILSQLLRDIAVDSGSTGQVELLQRTLLSRPNLERVATRTGLDLTVSNAAEREAMLTELGREVRIASQGRNLFIINYTTTEPRKARDVVQALVTLFMELATVGDRQQMENARTFIAQQIATYEAQLREAEQRRADFRARYVDLLPSDGGISRLEQARSKLQLLRGELQDATMRRTALRQQLETTPQTITETVIGGGGPSGSSALTELQRQRADMLITRTENHPDVRILEAQIAAHRAGGGARSSTPSAARPVASGTQRPNPLYEQLRVRLLDTETQLASLERQVRDEQTGVDRLEDLARTVPQVQAQFQNLDRDYNVLLRAYQELLERRESVQIAGAARAGADRVRLEVVDPPTVPLFPIGPNRVLFASVVLLAGLGAGAGLAFLLVMLDRSFHTVGDLRRIGLPVIGSISSTQPRPSATPSIIAVGCCGGLLIATYGALLFAGPQAMARLPDIIARFIA
ncbi:XrtA system polysaccharide chain length determinant [Belnapia moabensis]|uniref:XrtA system polysaccharide chain length determinant n=1 Tax=Belnapia moabensis TaxID=365533 RepID=UPI0005BB70D7|nr:XrtA system polysaccharide chain length determinant [Belnapia moabensis]